MRRLRLDPRLSRAESPRAPRRGTSPLRFGRAASRHVSRLLGSRSGRGVIPEGVTFPDGAMVTIVIDDEREATAELTPTQLAELDAVIAEADRSESVSSSPSAARRRP